MMNFLKDIGLFAVLVLFTSLVAALPIAFLARIRCWRPDQYKKWTILSLCIVSMLWYCCTYWALRMTSPVDWVGHDLGSVAQDFAFLGWVVLSRFLVIQIVPRIIALASAPTSLRSAARWRH